MKAAASVSERSDLPTLGLPLDHPRVPGRALQRATERHLLDAELTERLVSMAAASEATPRLWCLAAFAAVVARYGRQPELLLGYAASADRAAQVVPLALSWDDEPTPPRWIGRVIAEFAVSMADPERYLSVVAERFGVDESEVQTAAARCVLVDGGAGSDRNGAPETDWLALPGAELVFVVQGSGIDLTLALTYDTDLFEPSTVRRILGHVEVMLDGFLSDTDATLGTLPMLTPAEVAELNQLNDTDVDLPSSATLHGLVEAQVERSPDAVALVFGETTLTFGELNRRANRLARQLVQWGAGGDTLVGVYMERSIEMVVALLAVLKAGAAYIPLEPEYPAERIQFMINETQMPVVLTQEKVLATLPESDARIVVVDPEVGSAVDQPDGNLPVVTHGDDIAYVIYTSGSTGMPKGVMNTHRGICNLLLWMQRTFGLDDSDHVLQKTPFTFDVSVSEFFWPLLAGAQLVVAPPRSHRDVAEVRRMIIDHGITTIEFVPSALRSFLDLPRVEECVSLRRFLVAGETMTLDLQNRFFELFDIDLQNLYGPTEAAVYVTCWMCRRDEDLDIVPIGYPMANTRIHILDERLQPVPVGVVGELHIGGVQVANGYLNRPELTADRFIADPFDNKPGARIYNTGDLARRLPNGALEFLGRSDFQVKVRGYRIELGEIEAALLQHPEIRHAAVIVDDDGEHRRLVGHVVPTGGRPSGAKLRAFLETKLPEYMVPSIFVLHDAFQLTTSEKVDRRSLVVHTYARPELDTEYAPPRDELERYLVDLWKGMLNLDEVGIHDRFFDLGGDSLLAAEMVNRLHAELGEFIFVITVFQSPTVAEYAALLRRDYGGSIGQRFGSEAPGGASAGTSPNDGQRQRTKSGGLAQAQSVIDEAALEEMRGLVPTFARPDSWTATPANPPAVFVLSPPRSGTSLLRVMLAGHPALFAASELQLLGFDTMRQRRDAFVGKFGLWLEGSVRAVMELEGVDADRAKRIISDAEDGRPIYQAVLRPAAGMGWHADPGRQDPRLYPRPRRAPQRRARLRSTHIHPSHPRPERDGALLREHAHGSGALSQGTPILIGTTR